MDSADQTARSVQSGLDLHCPQKLLVSSTVGKVLIMWLVYTIEWKFDNKKGKKNKNGIGNGKNVMKSSCETK